MTDLRFAYSVIEKLDGWVAELARPIVPPRRIHVGDKFFRLEFQQHLPHTVMIGKLVRITSATRAAFTLAEEGFVTECGALLRIVSDFCTEVGAIGRALDRGGQLPKEVEEFVRQYFLPKQRTPAEYAAAERVRYVSREGLMKLDIRTVEGVDVDVERVRSLRRFISMAGDAYVHGAYETTMELCESQTGKFFLAGHPESETRNEHLEFAALKLHEVVVAVELTAAVTSTPSVFHEARATRREMDTRDPWKLSQAPV